MTTLVIIILMLLAAQCSAKVTVHNTEENENQIRRLCELMRGYLERTELRWREILPIKKKLEEKNPDQLRAFEMGYIMGDIVETYRKALTFTHKQMIKTRYREAERLRYMLYVQNAYLKTYHLTHMMHEINAKYDTDNTGQMARRNITQGFHNKAPSYYNTSGFYYTKELEDIRQARLKQRMKKVIDEKRIRQRELHRGTIRTVKYTKTTTNWWPVEYGWDIGYYW